MSMHEDLTRKVLKGIFSKSRLSEEVRDAVADVLIRNAIIIPHPGYGGIVHDLPDPFLYPEVKEIMDGQAASYSALMEDKLRPYYWHSNLDSIPDDSPGRDGFFWNNGYFPRGDARTLYAMVAGFAPALFYEVGVGNSTRIARKAISDFGLRTKIISIDPSPRAEIAGYSDSIRNSSVTDLDPREFCQLGDGDMLFIDGSHVCHVGTDVPYLFLRVFPLLSPGVIVHIHDIFLPWEYHGPMRERHYNEQHVLGGLIVNSKDWEILMPVHYASRAGIISHGGGSFWVRKIR